MSIRERIEKLEARAAPVTDDDKPSAAAIEQFRLGMIETIERQAREREEERAMSLTQRLAKAKRKEAEAANHLASLNAKALSLPSPHREPVEWDLRIARLRVIATEQKRRALEEWIRDGAPPAWHPGLNAEPKPEAIAAEKKLLAQLRAAGPTGETP